MFYIIRILKLLSKIVQDREDVHAYHAALVEIIRHLHIQVVRKAFKSTREHSKTPFPR